MLSIVNTDTGQVDLGAKEDCMDERKGRIALSGSVDETLYSLLAALRQVASMFWYLSIFSRSQSRPGFALEDIDRSSMLSTDVLEHVILPWIGLGATRFRTSEAILGPRRVVASAMSFQVRSGMEGAGASRVITAISSFMFETDMGAGVRLSVHSP
jgi:hypothetical protein